MRDAKSSCIAVQLHLVPFTAARSFGEFLDILDFAESKGTRVATNLTAAAITNSF